jgi:hypothetical protein
MAAPDAEAAGLIEYLLREEAARGADDIIYRRTNWSTTSRDLGPLRERVAGHLAGQLTGQGRAM